MTQQPLTSEYFDDETVRAIAAALPAMTHPDGTPFMFPQHADKFPGYSEDQQDSIGKMNFAIAEALLNHLQQNGRTVATVEQVAQAQRLGDHTVVSLHCATCAGELVTTTMGRDGKISIPPRSIDPDCATRHGAA